MAEPLGLDLASKKQRRRSDYPYTLDYRSRWSDNDMFHHLNNPVYGVLIDSIINEYLITKCGYSTSASEHIGLVGSSYCDYFGSAHYPGMINVGLRVVKLGKSSLMYEVGVFQEGEEQVKAVGGFIQIWVLRKTNKPTGEGIPAYIRKEVEKLLKGSEQDPSTKSKI
ncbi:thioesterase family protein [Zymoseptoria brevis]|uniref:Thioesterase family protein n=1 Tax=Zymoseptoria brevis TaxID=1047168 RepID=A0A0F4GY99_9PEZI|nr:thioesterase family protein [Zymoseptoria brevis]